MSRRKNESPVNNKKRAVLYCRVSTAMQGAADYSSLDAQEDQLKAFCKGKDWEVTAVYKDTKSGGTLERDELTNLCSDAERGQFDVIVVTKIDRLSRSMMDFKNITKRFNDLGVDFVSATQSIDTTTSGGKFMQDIFVAFAEFERNIIAERIRESIYQRAKQGHWHGGTPPLGYDNYNKKLEVNKIEAELVNKIFDYYIENPSCLEVARRLMSEGRKMKTQTVKRKDGEGIEKEVIIRGGNFTKANVLEILSNKVYIGLRKYKDEYFTGMHQPLVEEAKFEKVQKLLAASSQYTQARRKTTSSLILLGVTKCGLCGSSLTTSTGKGTKYYYYKCSKQVHQTKDHCQAKQLPYEMLENFAIQTIVQLIEEKEFFSVAFKQIQFNKGEELARYEKELADIKSNRTRLQTQIDNTWERMSLDQDTKNSEDYMRRINIWKEERARLDEEILSKTQFIDRIKKNIVDPSSLRINLEKFVEKFKMQPIEYQKRLTNLVFEEIISNFKSGDKDGLITLKIRGNGDVISKWSELVNASKQQVLTSVRSGTPDRSRTCAHGSGGHCSIH